MLDKINELTKPFQALFANISYRFSNPLGGAFLFSWITINWQAVYYFLFSDMKAAEKIEYLKALYITNEIISEKTITTIDWSSLFWCPAILAIGYLLLSPFISNISTGIWSLFNTSLEALRKKIVNKVVLLSTEDKHKIWIVVDEKETKHKEEIKKLQDKIDGFRNLNSLKEEQEAKPKSEMFELTLGNEENTNHENLSSDQIRKGLSSETHSHIAKIWISKQCSLNYDFPEHKKRVEFIFTIMLTLLSNNSYSPDSLNVQSVKYSSDKVSAELYSLEQLNLVSQDKVDRTYSLSKDVLELFKEVVQGKIK